MEARTVESPVFVIRPNSSLSWRGNLIFLATLATICFGIAGGFAWMGLWLVLPFAGIEVGVLAAALYICSRQARRCEVVRITDRQVEVEVGYEKPELKREFARSWVQVVLEPSRLKHHRSRLVLRAYGRDFEIGACLPEDERRALALALRQAIRDAPERYPAAAAV